MNFAFRSLALLFLSGGWWDANGLQISSINIQSHLQVGNKDHSSLPIDGLEFSSDLPAQSNIEFIAIDCGILYGPPNTLLAAKRALKSGAHGLNIDLILTKDLRLVGMHSPSHYLPFSDFVQTPTKLSNLRFDSLPKTPSCAIFRKYLASTGISASDLNGLMDCEPQAMNTVEEFLTAFPNTPMHFDMKADTLKEQFLQKQILEDILHSKFPDRANITDGSFTSIRFFHKPEETIELSKIQTRVDQNRPSLPIFLGDPAGDEYYLSMVGMSDYDGDVAYRTALSVIEKGPALAPPGVLGSYISLSTLTTSGFNVPEEWHGKFNVICDMSDLHQQSSVKACAPFRRVHTHFFKGVPETVVLNSVKMSLETAAAFTIRGVFQEGEDIPRSTFTRCAGKLITSMLVLLLQEKKILPGLDDPIVEHLELPDLKDWQDHPVLQKLTLRRVMSGTGGLLSTHWDYRLSKEYKSTEGISTQALRSIPNTSAVQNNFVYSNVAWTIVERAIEQATGLAFPLIARKYLFDPIGISEKTFYMERNGPACPIFEDNRQKIEMVNMKAAIGLCTVTDDWELLAQTLVAGGKSPKTNNQVISEESIRELYVDQLATHFAETLHEAKYAYPLAGLARHLFESDPRKPRHESNLSLSRGLGSYIIPQTNVVMAWGGMTGSLRYGNGDLDASIMIKPGTPTYLSQLTFNETRSQRSDKLCLKSAFGITKLTATQMDTCHQ